MQVCHKKDRTCYKEQCTMWDVEYKVCLEVALNRQMLAKYRYGVNES